MGTIYFVGCRDCKIYRDLDKFYTMNSIEDRAEALELAERIEKDSFRTALLVSFMWEHREHNCTAFNEHDSEWEKCLDENQPRESEKFWKK